MTKNQTVHSNRDASVDNFRGIATISIIFIHTVFWSGRHYVPDYMRNIALFFDVPIFFLLAGFSLRLSQRLNPIKQIFKLIYFFTFVVIFINLILGHFDFQNILESITLNSAVVTRLRVIDGSYWFVPMYCSALIVSCGLIQTIGKASLFFIPISIVYYLLHYNNLYSIKLQFMGSSVNGLLFFTSVMLFGYYVYEYRGKLLWPLLSILSLCIFLMMLYCHPHDFDLQSSKFPINLPYIIASMISIFLVMFFNSNKKIPILNFVGNKAIFFYAGQGVGSSILFFIDQDFNMTWYYKLIYLFAINLTITFISSFILMFIYTVISKLFYIFKTKFTIVY